MELTYAEASDGGGQTVVGDTVSPLIVDFVATDAIDVTAMRSATLLTPSGPDLLVIDGGFDALSGSDAALVVAGAEIASASLTPVSFFDNLHVAVVTSTGSDGNDEVVVGNLEDLHLNQNLSIDTGGAFGGGVDHVTFRDRVVLSGDLTVVSESILVESELWIGGAVELQASSSVQFTDFGELKALGVVQVVAGGDIQLAPDALIESDQSIVLESGGNILLGQLRSPGPMEIRAAASILDGRNTPGADITAQRVILSAGDRVGQADDSIETAVALLIADAGIGGLYVANETDLQLGDPSLQSFAISASGDVAISNTGDLTVAAPIESQRGDVRLSAFGDLIFISSATSLGSIDFELNRRNNLQTVLTVKRDR